MPLNTGLNPNLVKTGLDKVVFDAFDGDRAPNKAHADNPLLFNQERATNAAVIDEITMGVGEFETHIEEEALKEATVISDDKVTHSVTNWKKSLPIPVEYFEDAMFSHVQRTMADFGMKARLTQDKNAINTYANGLAGTTTTNNGTALFSNTQDTINGDTIDNLETGALSEANLETMVVSLQEQKAQDGTLGGHEPAFLLVPTQLYKEALEITKSELRSGSADNDLNYFSARYPGLQVLWSPFMGATFGGNDAYHILGSTRHNMNRAVRVPFSPATTKLIDYANDNQDRYIYKARFREIVYVSTYQGLVGSNGTT